MDMRQASACLAVAAALVAGCSNGGSGQDRAADTAAAKKMVLTSADLPAGWTAQPKDSADDVTDTEVIKELAGCLHVDAGDFHEDNPKAESPEFDSADTNSTAQVEVAFTPSTAQAGKAIAVLQRDDAEGCLSKVFKQEFDKQLSGEDTQGAQIGEPTVKRLAVASVGDDGAAFEVTIPISAAGQHLDVYLDVSFVRVGRIGITGFFGGQGQPFDAAMATQLTQKVVDRAPKS